MTEMKIVWLWKKVQAVPLLILELSNEENAAFARSWDVTTDTTKHSRCNSFTEPDLNKY
jgi:hypothetical protein